MASYFARWLSRRHLQSLSLDRPVFGFPRSSVQQLEEDDMPVGIIVMWGGLVAEIDTLSPGTWKLCDGLNGTPDLRTSFIKGAGIDAEIGGTGGASTHSHAGHAAHVVTQPSAHAAHVFTQPQAHVVTQPNAHVFTQPGGHSAHVVTQPAAHVFTQPSAHADVPNHTHPVTDPGHVHDENRNSATTGGLDGWAAGDTSTNTPLLTGYDTGSKVTGLTVNNPTGGVASQPHAGGAVDAHAGAAVDAHSAHSGGAVDAHAGTAVDTHAGAAVDGHSAHSGAGVDAHSAHDAPNSEPVYYRLAFIKRTA